MKRRARENQHAVCSIFEEQIILAEPFPKGNLIQAKRTDRIWKEYLTPIYFESMSVLYQWS